MVATYGRRHRTSRIPSRTLLAGAAGLLAVLAGCGGGGGSSSDSQNSGAGLSDPVIPLVGDAGKYSQTPAEANLSLGLKPPPVMPAVSTGENQWLRLEVPFDVLPGSILAADPLYAPFSHLNGSITITDELGNHIPVTVLVNGKDYKGKSRVKDTGFPADPDAGGNDQNLGKGTLLLIADDGDDDLSTPAAFGGRTGDSDGQPDTTDIQQIRIAISDLNYFPINALYAVTVGTADTTSPTVLSVVADTPDVDDPLDPTKAGPKTRFIVQFSEPCIPTTVGRSSILDGWPFTGNMPIITIPGVPPQRPFPHTYLTSQVSPVLSPLFIPVDVNPLNSNNLATYVVTPLIDLPPNNTVDLVVVDALVNASPSGVASGPIDLTGNLHIPGGSSRNTFAVGKGRYPVNAPVSPEAIYFIPSNRRGVGAIDLNGLGFNTNTPGANQGDYTKAALITKPFDATLTFPLKTYMNFTSGIGVLGHPAGTSHNQYKYPVGTGGFSYGFGNPNTAWEDPNDMGNPGTPVPGINEMSSGFETLVRNSNGEVILTGEDLPEVGTIADGIVGEFLDAAIFDTQSAFNSTPFHQSYYWGAPLQTNSIGEAPIPNPPPSRYWVGLQPIDILIDQSSPGSKARMIEGDEIWAGDKSLDLLLNTGLPLPVVRTSYQWVLPDATNILKPDRPPPHFDILPISLGTWNQWMGRSFGPPPQSATVSTWFQSRQQIGNYLYLADTENKQLHAINSNTFQTIESFDLPDPTGVAIDPASRYVFVSNAGDDSVSVIGADPAFPDFHQEVARVAVGRGPAAITAQPDGEDVFVANQTSDSISIISMNDLTVRKTLTQLVDGPREIVLAPRQTAFGFVAGIYFGYISNYQGNNIAVFESGPDGPQGIGCDRIMGTVPNDDQPNLSVLEPRGMCYSPYTNSQNLLASGVFVAHRDSAGAGLVSHIQFTHQILPGALPCTPPPGLFNVPTGFIDREFKIVGQWGAGGSTPLLGTMPTSVTLSDIRYGNLKLVPAQAPNAEDRGGAVGGPNSRHPVRFVAPPDPRAPVLPVVEPDRMYVSFGDTGRIQVLDPNQAGKTLGEVERPAMSISKMFTYFDQ